MRIGNLYACFYSGLGSGLEGGDVETCCLPDQLIAIIEIDGKLAGMSSCRTVVPDLSGHIETCVRVCIVKRAGDKEVADMLLGGAPKCDIAEDTTEAPHILIFEIAAGGKSIDFDGDDVAAGFYVGGDVEFGGVAAVDAVSDLMSVDPEKEAGIYTVESEEDPAAGPCCGQVEIAAVGAYWIAFVIRRIAYWWRAHHKGEVLFGNIGEITVIGSAVTLDLPAGGDGDVFP